MEQYERICAVEHAGLLDSRIRKVIQNPVKTLDNRVKEGMIVLELGCGPGFFTTEIARQVGKSGKVIAADLQQGMLDIVKNKIKGTDLENRIILHKCTEDKIGVTEKIDLAIAFFMIHEVPDKQKMLEEIKTILKPDGSLYIIEYRTHPPKKRFDEMIEIAHHTGLVETEQPRFLLSRSIILKPTPKTKP